MARKNPVTEYLKQIGKNGGDARAEALTPEERKASARKAARSRWGPPKNTSAALETETELAQSTSSIKNK